jgi:voltage-gated potassium channel
MSSASRRVFVGAVFFGMTCVIAVAGYMLAGWNFLDATYMVVITVFGVGYGETRTLDSTALKVFTMGVVVAGCSSGIYVVGGFVSMFAEGEIKRVLESRRMSKGLEQMSGHVLICGFGRVGQMIASDLAAAKHPFAVIDNSAARVHEAQSAGYMALLGSASEEHALEMAGIMRARALATVLPDDTANVFITLTARGMNPTIEIIARAESPATEKKLCRAGATRVVLPALIGATKITNLIVRPSADDLLMQATGQNRLNDDLKQIGLEMTEIELDSRSELVGQTVGKIEISGSGGFVVVAIKKSNGTLLRAPQANVKLAAGDVFVILSHSDALPQLTRRARPRAGLSHRGAAG